MSFSSFLNLFLLYREWRLPVKNWKTCDIHLLLCQRSKWCDDWIWNESSLLWALLEWGTVKVVFSGFRLYLVEKRDLILDSEGSIFVINQKRISNEYYQEKLFMLKFWQCFKYIASKLENVCQFFQISIIFHSRVSRKSGTVETILKWKNKKSGAYKQLLGFTVPQFIMHLHKFILGALKKLTQAKKL